MAVYSHHNVGLTSGILSSLGGAGAWGTHALQTITIADHTPRDPQLAIGYKGIVDYTSAVKTADVTLDCILVENGSEASSSTSLYDFADETGASTGFVLTSCNIGFTAGAPATVSFGYLTAMSSIASIDHSADPSVLTTGEEAQFAVVMGDDGTGLSFTGLTATPSGVQSITFSGTVNRDNILDVRASQPIEFVTTYPLDITVDAEYYGGFTIASLATGFSIGSAGGGSGNQASSATTWANATGLVLVESGESINVGGYLTITKSWQAADLEIPRDAP